MTLTAVGAIVGPAPEPAMTILSLLDWCRPRWQRDALCREYPHLPWFGQGRAGFDAMRNVCGSCLVREQCRRYAIETEAVGFWGGLTERERRALPAA